MPLFQRRAHEPITAGATLDLGLPSERARRDTAGSAARHHHHQNHSADKEEEEHLQLPRHVTLPDRSCAEAGLGREG